MNGIDSLMMKVQRITDIWETVKKGSIDPFILKIRITFGNKERQSHLIIIDMKHPRFLRTTPIIENSSNIYYSFAKLRKRKACLFYKEIHLLSIEDCVNLITSSHFQGRVPTDGYVLTSITSEFLSGLVKFDIVALINVNCPNPSFNLTRLRKELLGMSKGALGRSKKMFGFYG
jgi:hypothetical protein